jgi:glycosyltransferase involved in cell wall biosynthesis
MPKGAFVRYCFEAAELARELEPDVVYASDPLAAGPGLLAARVAGAKLVFHEHDSPAPNGAVGFVGHMRARCLRKADVVVFPNERRARIAQEDVGFGDDRLAVVWNLPRRSEVPSSVTVGGGGVVAYFHGSITPERLPMTVVDAIKRFGGRVELALAGYEAPGAKGYVQALVRAGMIGDERSFVAYRGLLPSRSKLLELAARAHIGLALMPPVSDDVNMVHMVGASNKIFDYMAAGLVPIVSDLPDWRETFVVPGYALACDPRDADSLFGALRMIVEDSGRRHAIAERNRAKILADWNYDEAFSVVIDRLCRRRR